MKLPHVDIRRAGVALLILLLLLTVFPLTPALAAKVIDPVPKTGKVGDLVDVYGAGFGVDSPVTVYFSSDVATVNGTISTSSSAQVKSYKRVATVNTTAFGDFSTYFTLPAVLNDGSINRNVSGGTYYVVVAYGTMTTIQAVYPFTVLAVAAAGISPSAGEVGQSVTVSGSNFAASEEIVIKFGGTQIATTSSDASGTFTTSFTVTENPAGAYQISVSDGATTKTQTFTLAATTSFTPTSGFVGTDVTVSGSGFAASQTVRFTFDGVEIATTGSDAKGNFAATVAIPGHRYGSFLLSASDGTNSGSISFVISPKAAITPASGFVGTEVTVSGNGFAASKSLPVLFAGDLVLTANTDAGGSFSGTFVVPSGNAGSYAVEVSNEGTLVKAGDFSIATSATISPLTTAESPGHLGSQLTVSGVGFTTGRTVSLTYDGTGVATATVGSDGTFQTTFTVTGGGSGEHTVIATDVINTSRFSFFMEAEPPAAPVLLQPPMGLEAEPETVFDWQDVTDPSGVSYTLQAATAADFSLASIALERKGLTASEYSLSEIEKLPALKDDAPYYWRVKAIDGVANESQWSATGTFLIKGFSLSMPHPLIYVLIGVGALVLFLAGIWLGRRTAYY